MSHSLICGYEIPDNGVCHAPNSYHVPKLVNPKSIFKILIELARLSLPEDM